MLIVSTRDERRDELSTWLQAAGYVVEAVSGFVQGRQACERVPPDLLVADVKLEAYNGIHLAMWSRNRHPATQVLLIGDADLVLQHEAERERAKYLVQPVDERRFLAAVAALREAPRQSRRSARRRVNVDAVIEGVSVSVLDLSREGVCLVLHDAESLALPPFFTLRVPSWDLSCRLQRIWMTRPKSAQHTLVCGACLAGLDSPAAVAWRSLVDRLSLPPAVGSGSADW